MGPTVHPDYWLIMINVFTSSELDNYGQSFFDSLASDLGTAPVIHGAGTHPIGRHMRFENNQLLMVNGKQKIVFDFVKYWNSFKRDRSKGPLNKALGSGSKAPNEVIDMTCGTGKDSLLMLNWGLKVHGFERNPEVYALLLSAKKFCLNFGENDELKEVLSHQFTLSFGQAQQGPFHTSYFDPLYEKAPSARKAASRKEMGVFHEMIGSDQDAVEVLKQAQANTKGRVVVKRPLKGADLAPGKSGTILGKSTRYDIYPGLFKGDN
jgi:16S rRNA (guanine1516-N2)-methyltransferase